MTPPRDTSVTQNITCDVWLDPSTFAQLTLLHPKILCFSPKCSFSCKHLHPTCYPWPTGVSQTAFWTVQPFLHSSRQQERRQVRSLQSTRAIGVVK